VRIDGDGGLVLLVLREGRRRAADGHQGVRREGGPGADGSQHNGRDSREDRESNTHQTTPFSRSE
jgi:hypothetical protein